MEFAPCKHRFKQVARVHRAFGFTRADYRMQFVDEKDNLTFALLDFGKYGFKPFFELAAVLRARHQRAHIQRKQLSVFKVFGNVAFHYSYGKPFGDSGFTYARLADQDGVVFGFSRKNTNNVSYLFVSADYGVEFTRPRPFDEILTVFIQHVVSVFGVLACNPYVAADFRQRLHIGVFVHARRFENLSDFRVRFFYKTVKEMFDRNELVFHIFSLFFGFV